MNASTNMNIINAPTSRASSTSNQQIKINKDDFLNMLKMLMTENQDISQLNTQESTMLNPDILLLMAGNNVQGGGIEDAVLQGENAETNKNKLSGANKLYTDMYGAYMLNPVIDSNILNSVMAEENASQDVCSEDIPYGMPEYIYLDQYAQLLGSNQFQNLGQTGLETLSQGTLKTQYTCGEQPVADSMESLDLDAVDTSKDQIGTGAETHKANNSFAEKLISQIEDSRSRLKNEIDFSASLLMANDRAGEKIITVSDEASELKPQIMAQIADKIVLIAEEEPGAEGQIKNVTMELQPHGLGKVDIKLTYQGDKLNVEIKALNKETQKILQSNAKELTDILSKSTKTSVDVVIKDDYMRYENHAVNNDHSNSQQEHKHNQDQNHGEAGQHERNKDGYSSQNKNSTKDEESIFSQMINLKNIKLSI